MNWRRAILLFSALGAVGLGCRHTPTPETWRPHESLITILAEMELHRKEDFYRFGYPRDVTDQNVFRATLVRIANWERQWPGQWKDIVAFSKALAFASLGEFDAAESLFEDVASMETDLSAKAEEHRAVMADLAALDAIEPEGETVEQLLAAAGRRVERWRREAAARFETEWGPVTMVAWEEAEMQQVQLVGMFRHLLEDGDAQCRAACEALIENHAGSHRENQHWLRLGDFHRELAERLVVFSPPARTDFDLDGFEAQISAARAIYLRVERADGFRERLEARARLAALEEFAQRVRAEAR